MLNKVHVKLIISFLILACFLTYCSKDIQEPQNSEAAISIISGNHQKGRGGEILTGPVAVKVTNSKEQPLEDIVVLFEVVEGGGKIVNKPTVRTNSEGIAEVQWKIGSSYNAIKASILDAFYKSQSCYIYSEDENPQGMNKAKSISTLKKIDEYLYSMSFYGDYSEILEDINQSYISYFSRSSTNNKIKNNQCSMFSAFGNPDKYLYGRSYDNPQDWDKCLTLVGQYNPPDGYRSIALNRMKDCGFEAGTNFDNVSFNGKTRLFEAAYFTPDGINEHGVAAGCAGVRGLPFVPDENKKSICLTRLVREILDHAKNVDEAVDIARQFNIFDEDLSTLATHYLIADPSGRSVVLELYDGEIQVIPNNRLWQAITNSPIYNVPIYQRRASCWRYKNYYDFLEPVKGNIDINGGLNILEQNAFEPGSEWPARTQWSSLYDLTERKLILAIYYDFNNLYHFSFDDEW